MLQWKRLYLVANNSRFLILSGIDIPNLASKTLSLNLKRLSRDWQKIYGHPILLVETFVDISRFSGTCYKAANWIYLGQTQGFGKSARRYYYHGQPKAVFIRTLRKSARHWLTDPLANAKLIRKVGPMKFTTKQLEALVETLKSLPDPRHNRGKRHRMISIIAIANQPFFSNQLRCSLTCNSCCQIHPNLINSPTCLNNYLLSSYL